MRYRSKIDWWLAAIIVSLPLVLLVLAAALVLVGETEAALGIGLALLAVIGVYVAVVWPVEYILEADALVVRFGLVRSRIPYSSIRSVRATRIPIASPALSLDRLAIDASRGLPVIIAPADRERFVAELAARAPQIAA